MKPSRRTILKTGLIGGAAASAALKLATPAIASDKTQWKMVTSWPKNLPGPGVTAQRLADRITTMSGGRLEVKLFAAGELLPPLEVFDGVSQAIAQMAHTAPLFWSGKLPIAPAFTAAPFGLTPLEHITWVEHGGGQQLWDELYRPHNLKPFMAGNTGYQMGGWYKRQINSLADLKGIKIRMPGFGGLVVKKMGAVPVVLAPGEIFLALQSGVIDATEFLGPFSDAAMSFHQVAKNYYYPGFHEPNGSGEALVNAQAYDALPKDLQAIVAEACRAENIFSLGEAEWENGRALAALQQNHGVVLRRYPDDVLEAARKASLEVMAELADKDEMSKKVLDSYRAAARHLGKWSEVSVSAFLSERAGLLD